MIINPASVDPSKHIMFRRHEAVKLTDEGEETIRIFDLNNKRGGRAELVEERKQVFELYKEERKQEEFAKQLLSLSSLPAPAVTIANAILDSCRRSIAMKTSPAAPHSGMLISQINKE